MQKALGDSIVLIGIGFPNADASVARLFPADFLGSSAISEGYGGGVNFISCRLGDGDVFSDAVDDHLSLDEASMTIPC